MCVPQVYSASCSSDELLQVLKNEGLTDLLFLALLVGKESSGAWQEALQMFRWMQKVEEKAGREAGLQCEVGGLRGRRGGALQACERGGWLAAAAPKLKSLSDRDV